MDDVIVYGVVIMIVGLFVFFGVTRRWKFFMRSRKVQFIMRIFGEKGGIIFYQILGLFLCVYGIWNLIHGILTLVGIVK